MIENERWKAVSIELSQGLPQLQREPEYGGVRAVFFWNGVPLGHCELAAAALPLAPVQLANVAAKAIWQATGDYVLDEGFQSALPGLPAPPLEDPVQALTELVQLDSPVARMAVSMPPLGPKPRAKLTVAVCTRERPAELVRCLESLAASTEPADEILVVDNAPDTNDTHTAVAAFPGIRYCYQPRAGLSAARNAALAAARGDIVAFADDDVVVHPDWTARIRRCFDDPLVMIATGLVLPAELETRAQAIFEQSFHFFHQGYRRRYFDPGYFPSLRNRGVPVWEIGAGANMAIRKKAFDLGYRFDTRLGPGVFGGCGEDSEFWYRILADGWSCRYEPSACLFHYHRREIPALRRLVNQYMQGHVAALVMQFRKFGHLGNLRRLLFQLPAEYVILVLRAMASGFPLDYRILLRGSWGCLAGLRAAFSREQAEIPAE